MEKESIAHYIPECDNPSFKCPISLDLMTDPVVLNGDGYTYERKNIEKHLKFRYTSPMTNKHLKEDHFLINNNNLKSQIEEWKMNNIKKRKIILKDDLIKYEDDNENVTCEKIELYDEKYTYKGPVKDGFKDDKGSIFYKNGDKYFGEFYKNNKHGKGIMIYNNNDTYEGEWFNDLKSGLGSYITIENKIIGNWLNGKLNGLCRIEYDDYIIEIEWQEGVISNSGTIIYKNGSRYTGEIRDNKRNGLGQLYLVDGTKYDCNWLNDDKVGDCEIIYKNGDIYRGDVSINFSRIDKINFPIDELLKIINDEVNIDIESKELINSILKKLVETIIDKFDFNLRCDIYDDSDILDCIEEDSSDEEYSNHKLNKYIRKKKIFLSKERLLFIVNELLPGQLKTRARSEINIHINKSSIINTRFISKDVNLKIKIKSIYKFLKNICHFVKIQYKALVGLCTLLEYMMLEILELSSNSAVDKSETKENVVIKVENVKSAITNDDELLQLVRDKLKIEL